MMNTNAVAVQPKQKVTNGLIRKLELSDSLLLLLQAGKSRGSRLLMTAVLRTDTRTDRIGYTLSDNKSFL